MRIRLQIFLIVSLAFGIAGRLYSQGYIVTNGVVYIGYSPSIGSEIDVLQNPADSNYTGFFLASTGNPNTFAFNVVADEGVRVILVSSGDAITLNAFQSGNYTELLYPNSYVFDEGVPFYVGLYTGENMGSTPPPGTYNNPVFGWAQLVNNAGVIELLGSALEYGGGGIYAGTQTIMPVPEPSALGLFGLGLLGLGWHLRQRNSCSPH